MLSIPNARFYPCMDSFLGAAHGLLRALEDEQDIVELWGLSGLALRTQVHSSLHPSGLLPREWDQTLPRWMRRLGHDAFAGLRDQFFTENDLRDLQGTWMRSLEQALAEGRPALSYGLHGPAFGLIRGFDAEREEYLVSTFMDGKNESPISVQDVGSTSPPLIFFLIPTGPVHGYDYARMSMDAISEALRTELGEDPDPRPRFISGTAAYNAWSTAIETENVEAHWMVSLHAAYYLEARSAGADWLRRLSAREQPEPALAAAAEHLEHEAQCFRRLARVFSLQGAEEMNDPQRRTEASACLRAARAEHIAAIEILARLRDAHE